MDKPASLRKQTLRRNGKWAKLDRSPNGDWFAALGWAGQFQAIRVVNYSRRFRHGALISALNWLDDGQ